MVDHADPWRAGSNNNLGQQAVNTGFQNRGRRDSVNAAKRPVRVARVLSITMGALRASRMIAITAATLYTPLERIDHPLLTIEDGVITHVGARSDYPGLPKCHLVDFGDAILAPGLVDIHIHGGGGHDVMEPGGDALSTIETLLAGHGVSSYCPTTVTAPLDLTLAALERLANAIEAAEQRGQDGTRARPIGIHLEGPFLSHARRGVHPPENLLRPTTTIFERMWQAARGHVLLMTIAPELDGALEVIAQASKRGVAVSLGHSDANVEQTRAAIRAGARHATHTFNAMRPLNHRDPGILGVVLGDHGITADIIADGIHVDPLMVDLFLRLKGPERAVLITDATAATGMPEGKYRMGGFEFEVRDGKCLANGTIAGSLLTLDVAVQNAMKFSKLGGQQAVRAATLNPASVVRTARRIGTLAAGSPADIAVMNRQHEVIKTIINGNGV